MKVLYVMDSSGDKRVIFEGENSDEARALFERLAATGAVAFKIHRDGKPDEKVTDFDKLEDETVIVPRVVSG